MIYNIKTKPKGYVEADSDEKQYEKLMDTTKTKIEECVDSALKEGFFIHSDGEINNHWIDLSGLHHQFLLNKEVVKKALRMKLIKKIEENSLDTIIFTTQCFSETSDFKLSCIDFIVDEVLQEFNRKKKIEYTYLRRKTPGGELTLIPAPTKKEINVLLITALSSHDELIKKTLNPHIVSSKSKSVLSIINMKTRIDDKTTVGPSKDDSHTCLINFESEQRPNIPKEDDHSIVSDIDYDFSDYKKDLNIDDKDYNFIDYLKDFFRDVRGISVLVLFLSLVCVIVYYNPPNINGFFDFLKQNRDSLIIGVVTSIIGSAIFVYMFKKFSKAKETERH